MILADQRLDARPASRVGGTGTWAADERMRACRAEPALSAQPFTTGAAHDAGDVVHMAANCSRTPRPGARRRGPRLQAAYDQIAS